MAESQSIPMIGRVGWWLPLMIASVLLFAALGTWQLQRAAEKEALAAVREKSAAQAPLTTLQGMGPDGGAYRPLVLRGRFLDTHSFYLDNRTRDGQAGLEVITPFRERGTDRIVLVNRGWLPFAGDRRHLPVPPVAGPVESVHAEVYASPRPLLGSLEESLARAGKIAVVPYLEADIIGRHFNLPLEPVLLRLQEGSEGALRLDWPQRGISPSRHRGYALQWYALAAAFLVLTVYAGRQQRRNNRQQAE